MDKQEQKTPTSISDFLLLTHGDKDLNIRDVSIAMSKYAGSRIVEFKIKASKNAQLVATDECRAEVNRAIIETNL